MIYGLAGNAPGAGKDTAGAMLVQCGAVRMAFGDALKDEVAKVTMGGAPIPMDIESDPRLSLLHFALQQSMGVDPHAKPTGLMMRTVLQLWGTEYRRAKDEDYWPNALANSVDAAMTDVVITDVRIPNEVAFVKRRGGVIWYIERPKLVKPDHASEQLVREVADVVIVNGGSEQAFLKSVERAILASQAQTAGWYRA